MIQDAYIISLGLLLDLQNVNVLRELFNLLASDPVDKSSFTDAVPAHQTVLAALHQLELGLLQQCLATNDKSQVSDQDVSLERIHLIVHDSRGRDALLVLDKFFYLFVKGILHTVLLFGCPFFGAEGVLLFCVIVTLGLFSVQEGVQELFLSVDA